MIGCTQMDKVPESSWLSNLLEKEAYSGRKHVTKDQSIYWGSRTETGELVSSGIYFYTIQTDQYTKTKKMVILK